MSDTQTNRERLEEWNTFQFNEALALDLDNPYQFRKLMWKLEEMPANIVQTHLSEIQISQLLGLLNNVYIPTTITNREGVKADLPSRHAIYGNISRVLGAFLEYKPIEFSPAHIFEIGSMIINLLNTYEADIEELNSGSLTKTGILNMHLNNNTKLLLDLLTHLGIKRTDRLQAPLVMSIHKYNLLTTTQALIETGEANIAEVTTQEAEEIHLEEDEPAVDGVLELALAGANMEG